METEGSEHVIFKQTLKGERVKKNNGLITLPQVFFFILKFVP
jgi:hypothetical protein